MPSRVTPAWVGSSEASLRASQVTHRAAAVNGAPSLFGVGTQGGYDRSMLPGDRSGAAQALPTPGHVIGGKYQIVRVIGEGGMGVVFEAQHLKLRQRVAVKMLLPDM